MHNEMFGTLDSLCKAMTVLKFVGNTMVHFRPFYNYE